MNLYLLCLVLFCIGLYAAVRKRNLIKIIIGIAIMEYAVNLFFILAGYRKNGRAPIYSPDQNILDMVDPLPQAIVLISLVVSLAVIVVASAIAMRIYEKYKTFDITKIRKLKS